MAKTEILGIGDMRTNFAEVRQDMQKRVARKVVVAGGRVLKAEAIAIATANGSKVSGDMIKNIAIKRESKAPQGTEQIHLGVRHGRDQTKKTRSQGTKYLAVNSRGRIVTRRTNDPYYWRWVELGHKITPREVSSGVTHYEQKFKNGRVVSRQSKFSGLSIRARRRAQASGQVDPKPFIQPALERKRSEAIQAMGDAVVKEVLKDRS